MYLYVRCNPFGLVDPLGLWTLYDFVCDIGCGIKETAVYVGTLGGNLSADASAQQRLESSSQKLAGQRAAYLKAQGDTGGATGAIIANGAQSDAAIDGMASSVESSASTATAVVLSAGALAGGAVGAGFEGAEAIMDVAQGQLPSLPGMGGAKKATGGVGAMGAVAAGTVVNKSGDTAKALDKAGDAAKAGETVVAKGGTYKLRDPETLEVRRTGQTNDLDRRKGEHGRDERTKDLLFEVDRRSDDKDARRGREQRLYNQHSEADLNKRRPIAPKNTKRDYYLKKGDDL